MRQPGSKEQDQREDIKQVSNVFDAPFGRTGPLSKQSTLVNKQNTYFDNKPGTVLQGQDDDFSKIETIQRDKSQNKEFNNMNQEPLGDNYLKPAMVGEHNG